MRPLNRPMFRNGGPIKEGIMSGMKEPQAINTVGSPIFPRSPDGRSKHALQAAAFIPAAIQAVRVGAQRAIPKIANFFRTQVGTKGPGSVRIPGPAGTPGRFTTAGSKVVDKQGPGMPIYQPNFLGRDPTVRLIGGIYKGVTNPAVTGMGAKAARLVFSPTGLVTGAVYAGGKFFDKDGNEIPADQAEDLGLTAGDKIDEKVNTGESDQGGRKLTRDEEIEANRKRYYELMGIDKMQKDAVYNTLIDASNQIREGGTIKDQLKSGSLASNVINALSKNLDKSVDLKRQIDAAILKGEITKDINKDKDALTKELTKKRIQIADKTLAGNNLSETAAQYQKAGLPFKGQALFAEADRQNIDVAGIFDTKKVDDFMEDNKTKTEADFVNEEQARRVRAGQDPLPPGNYVVGGRIVTISSGGLVSDFLY